MKIHRKKLFLLFTFILLTVMGSIPDAKAQGEKFQGAGLAIGLAGLGAAVGMGMAAAASIGAMVDKPEMFSRAILFIVLIEAIAIYGLVVSFMILIL
ncbi:MAG: ATPase [Nitrososphaeria archaeon]|nr:ATPase [Nitrososphaeria archaeon]NIN51729.1 ATPase [Nitrososphaeria archaeon]NIQ32223.1 ATPase [Nitrososphaeria archaeon]